MLLLKVTNAVPGFFPCTISLISLEETISRNNVKRSSSAVFGISVTQIRSV